MIGLLEYKLLFSVLEHLACKRKKSKHCHVLGFHSSTLIEVDTFNFYFYAICNYKFEITFGNFVLQNYK